MQRNEHNNKNLGKGNLIFSCTGSRGNYFGSVGLQNKISGSAHLKIKILIIELKELVLHVNTKYISNRLHLFTPNFSNVKCTNFFVFYVFYCNLNEKDHIRRIINSKKSSIIIVLIYQNLGLVGLVQ